jgi:hypothetical protein
MLRWVSPIKDMVRTTTRPVNLHGTRIPEGAEVMLVYPAANRDEAVFDRPETFDAAREPNPHLAFGSAHTSGWATSWPGRNCGSCSPGCPIFTTTRTSDDRRRCALPQESAVQRCDPQQLEQHRARRDHAERTAGPLCITGHLQQGTKAARIAELQRGEVNNYRPAVMVDDPGDVPERRVGGSNVQFATDACDGFAGRFDSVAQLKRRGSAPILAFRHDDYLLGF